MLSTAPSKRDCIFSLASTVTNFRFFFNHFDIYCLVVLNLNIMNEQKILEKAENIYSFNSHLLVYILVNILLFGVDLYDNGHIYWAFFSLRGWGIGLLSHYISVFNPFFSVEKEVEKLTEKHKRSIDQ